MSHSLLVQLSVSAVASSKSSGECSPEVAVVGSSRAQLRSSSRSKGASERDAGRTVASVGPCACVWMQEAQPSRSEMGGRTAAAGIAKLVTLLVPLRTSMPMAPRDLRRMRE